MSRASASTDNAVSRLADADEDGKFAAEVANPSDDVQESPYLTCGVLDETEMPLEMPLFPLKGAEARRSVVWQKADVPGRGVGLVATRDIVRGEVVMEESPLLKVSTSLKVGTDAHTKWIRKVVALELSAGERRDYFSLCSGTEEQTAEAIFKRNTFSVMGEYDIVYHDISRLNHSCNPNCAHSWDNERSLGQIRALRTINAGDELLITYTQVCAPSACRNAFLGRVYGFQCDCRCCREGSQASDFRRQSIQQCAVMLRPQSTICQIYSQAAAETEEPREQDFEGMSEADKRTEKLRVVRAKKIIADGNTARELGLRLAVQVLRLVQAEGLDAAGDVAANVCAAAAFLLAEHDRQQEDWSRECLERMGIGGSSTDVASAEMALQTIAIQPFNGLLAPISPQVLDVCGDPREALTGAPEALIEAALHKDTSDLLLEIETVALNGLWY